jgi:hypothetical protein
VAAESRPRSTGILFTNKKNKQFLEFLGRAPKVGKTHFQRRMAARSLKGTGKLESVLPE